MSSLRRSPLIRAGRAGLVCLVLAGCGSAVPISSGTGGGSAPCTTPGPANQQDSFSQQVPLTTTPRGLKYGDISVGCGKQLKPGQQVAIEYTGWLSNGKLFDTSRAAGRTPFAFLFDTGQVIPGFDDGLLGMRVGGKRRIVIPPALGYGPQGRPPVIPGNSTLIFDVEVISATG